MVAGGERGAVCRGSTCGKRSRSALCHTQSVPTCGDKKGGEVLRMRLSLGKGIGVLNVLRVVFSPPDTLISNLC